MAHLNWHGKVIRVYEHKVVSRLRYHITETDHVLVTRGPRLGKCKVIRTKDGKFFSAKAWEAKNLTVLASQFNLTSEESFDTLVK